MLPCEDVQRRVPTSECADAQNTRRMPAGLIKGGANPPRIFYGTAPGTREAAIAAATVPVGIRPHFPRGRDGSRPALTTQYADRRPYPEASDRWRIILRTTVSCRPNV